MNTAVIGIGSNIKPVANVRKAINIISDSHECVAISRIRKTKPVGYKDQPDYLNGAMLISTHQSMRELRKWLKSVEDNLGRIRTKNRYGPRTIDLDILVWNKRIVDDDVFQRDFLKKAVEELLPGQDLGKT